MVSQPSRSSRLLRHLVTLVMMWSPVTLHAEHVHDNHRGITRPLPRLSSAPLFYARHQRSAFEVQRPLLLERRYITSSPEQEHLHPGMESDPRGATEDQYTRQRKDPSKVPSLLLPCKRVHLNRSVVPESYERNESSPQSFHVNSSYSSCSQLTRLSVDVIKDGEHFLDWPSLLCSIESCCHGIDAEHSSLRNIYDSVCDDYYKFNYAQFQGNTVVKKVERKVAVHDFTDGFVAAVVKAVVADDEREPSSLAGEDAAAMDKSSEQETSTVTSDRSGGRLLVFFVPQINETNSEEVSPGERGEDLARLSLLKIIKAKIVKSFKQFEKWLNSQSTLLNKVVDRTGQQARAN